MKKLTFALILAVAACCVFALAQTTATNRFSPVEATTFAKALEGRTEAPKDNSLAKQLNVVQETQGRIEMIIVVWPKNSKPDLSVFQNALIKVEAFDAAGKVLGETRYAKLEIGAPEKIFVTLPLHLLQGAKGAEVTFLPEGTTTFIKWKPTFKPQE